MDLTRNGTNRSCRSCTHNNRKLDICWMYGTPPDLKEGPGNMGEECPYWEEMEFPAADVQDSKEEKCQKH